MPRDARRPEILDYRQPDRRPMRWQFIVAYVLMILPIIYVGMSGSLHPVPVERAVTVYVLIGIAVGASLFVVRRQPRILGGWIGLLGWGGLCAGAIVNALLK